MKANKLTLKEKTIKRLVKWGWNEETATNMVNEKFDIAVKCWPHATPAKLADVIGTIG